MKLSGVSLRKFIDKPDADMRAALVFGPNAGFVSEAAQAIARWAMKGDDDPYAVTKLSEDEIKRDGARLNDALAAQSLLGGASLVWARVDGKGADGAILAALKEIEAGASYAYLLVEGGELSSKGELAKAFDGAKRAASLAFYEESEGERAAFARETAQRAGVVFDSDGVEAFLAALPHDRALARREIEKLALYAHGLGRDLGADDVAALMSDESESALDAASLAAVNGRAAQAIEALSRIEGLSGVSALRALERRVLQLSDLRTMIDDGVGVSEAVGKLRPPVFWKERDAIGAQARNWTAKKLSAAFDALWAAELRAKTAGAPQELIAADAYRAVANLVSK